jgi:hypothetical protein
MVTIHELEVTSHESLPVEGSKVQSRKESEQADHVTEPRPRRRSIIEVGAEALENAFASRKESEQADHVTEPRPRRRSIIEVGAEALENAFASRKESEQADHVTEPRPRRRSIIELGAEALQNAFQHAVKDAVEPAAVEQAVQITSPSAWRVRIACAQQSHDSNTQPHASCVVWNEAFEFRVFTRPAGADLLLKVIGTASSDGANDPRDDLSIAMNLEAKIKEIEQRKQSFSDWLSLDKTHRLRVSIAWNPIRTLPGRALSAWKHGILYLTVCSINGIERNPKFDSELYAKFRYGDIERDTQTCPPENRGVSVKLGTSLALESRKFLQQSMMIEVWERSQSRDDMRLGYVPLDIRLIDRLCKPLAELTIVEEHSVLVRLTFTSLHR